MPGCKFQDKWLTNNAFKSWIRKDTSNSHGAFCQLCNKSIDLTSIGKTALTSHSKGKKHKENEDRLRSGNIQVFMHLHKFHSTTPATTSASAVSLSSYITKSETLNAEVWWCLKTVASNYSFSSNEATSYTFQQMFPDCHCQEYELWRDKIYVYHMFWNCSILKCSAGNKSKR
ncbi:hypothetical protein ACJMK2_000700 [Sinanodonta woodiana]|uniref:Uncharacterized protein n=1 Tax=Sinanodonta woodiana TaxID=1069815 RepID=A0ABD3XRU2_SINWO